MRTLLTSLVAAALLASAVAPAAAHDDWRYRRHHRHHNNDAAAIAGALLLFGLGAAALNSNRQPQGFYGSNSYDYFPQQQYGSGDASNCQPGSIALFTRDGRFAGCAN